MKEKDDFDEIFDYSSDEDHEDKVSYNSSFGLHSKRSRSEDIFESKEMKKQKQTHEGSLELISVSKLDKEFRPIFQFSNFNRVQSQCFKEICDSDMNMVISAPTGAGKTVLFELAMIRLISKYLKGGLKKRTPGGHKVIYMAPIKALCQEKFEEWKKKFQKIGLKCAELTGDTVNSNLKEFGDVDIILTTPEKWDSTTRKWKDYGFKTFISQIELILIDEVHILNEERGACLEAVISRMKTVCLSSDMMGTPNSNLRIIALSATIPNIEDIGEWLNAPTEGIKVFGDEYRPCKLNVNVIGYKNTASNPYLFENNLNYKLAPLIHENNDQKPTLIFCSTRKAASSTAIHLSKECNSTSKPFVTNQPQKRRLKEASRKTTDKNLQNCIENGIGYHSAGMSLHDRKLIEDLFLKSELLVVCTTSTLAQGVNFPAHLVVIKGTQQYRSGSGYVDIGELMLLQMIGRAGRPQFDEFGVAIIMTESTKESQYEDIVLRKQLVESHFHNYLIEHMNAEIVLKNIVDIKLAVEWLKSTFLYIRMKKNPTHYNISSNISEKELDNYLKDVCVKNFKLLSEAQLIVFKDGSVCSTPIGESMARFYVAFETMKSFQEMKNESSLSDIICSLSKAKEFDEFRFRQGDKKHLNAINQNKSKMRFPIKGKIKEVDEKVNCLIQAAFGDIPCEEWNLKQQQQAILHTAPRIMRCMIDFLVAMNCFVSLQNAIILGKCIEQKMWENTLHVLKQLDGIGATFSSNLVSAKIVSFETLEETNPRRIEAIVGRNAPFGSQLVASSSKVPKFSLDVSNKFSNGKNTISVKCKRVSKFLSIPHGSSFQILVGNKTGELICRRKFDSNKIENEFNFNYDIEKDSNNSQLSICLLNEYFIGVDVYEKLSIHNLKNVKIKKEVSTTEIQSPCKHQCKDKSKCKHICCKSPMKRILFENGEMKDNSPNPMVNSNSPKFLNQTKPKKSIIIHDDFDEDEIPDEFFDEIDTLQKEREIKSQMDETEHWKKKYGMISVPNSGNQRFPRNNLNKMSFNGRESPIIPVTKVEKKVTSPPLIPVSKMPSKKSNQRIQSHSPIIQNHFVKAFPVLNVAEKNSKENTKTKIYQSKEENNLKSSFVQQFSDINPNIFDFDYKIELEDCSDLMNEFL
eukprot:gene11936-5337_t